MSSSTAPPAPVPPTASAQHAPAGADGRGRRSSAQPEGERRHPWLITLIALAMLAAILVSVARGLYRDGPLEPDAPTGQGSKAVVQVLEDLGVEVDVERHTADAAEALRSGRTVLVTSPGELGLEQLSALAEAQETGGGRLVLVQPDFVTLSAFTSLITPSGSLRGATELEADPECGDLDHGARTLAVPAADESIRQPATLYRTSGSADSCFRDDNGALLAEDDALVVLGSPDLLTNDQVGRVDNAALALDLLGAEDELSWYVPSPSDPMASTSQTPLGYLPDWAGPLLLWLAFGAVLALLALGRRFGPVVIEPLPVTVRPQELVLGRARMLQRADARDAAATALRSATCSRLADRLGLRHESSLEGLLAALAPHVDRSEEQLRSLLGPAPVTSDHDLVQLAHELDRLEKEIDR